MSKITEKNKLYKIAFKLNKERQKAVEILQDLGFDVEDEFCKTYLFLSTYDNLKIGRWDNESAFNEETDSISLTFPDLLELCKNI